MNAGADLVSELGEVLQHATTLWVLVIVAVSAIIRGLTGFGFAILAVPLISLFISPMQAVVFAIIMQMLIGPFGVPQALAHIDKPLVLKLGLLGMLTTPLGVLALSHISPEIARLLIAAVALSAFLFFMLKRAPDIPESRTVLALTGLSAGILNGFAAMPGPPVILYFVRSGVPPVVARASMISFFFATGIAGVCAIWWRGMITRELLMLSAVALPVMIAGNHLGARFFGRVAEPLWRGVVVALLMVSAAGALARLV